MRQTPNSNVYVYVFYNLYVTMYFNIPMKITEILVSPRELLRLALLPSKTDAKHLVMLFHLLLK